LKSSKQPETLCLAEQYKSKHVQLNKYMKQLQMKLQKQVV